MSFLNLLLNIFCGINTHNQEFFIIFFKISTVVNKLLLFYTGCLILPYNVRRFFKMQLETKKDKKKKHDKINKS